MAGEKLTPEQAETPDRSPEVNTLDLEVDQHPAPNRHGGSPAVQDRPQAEAPPRAAKTANAPQPGGPVGAPPRAVRPLLRLRVRNRLKAKLAEAKEGKGKAAKALTAARQKELLDSVDNETIDAAYDMVQAEGGAETEGGRTGGPLIDFLISSGLIEKIVGLLIKLLTG